MQSKSAAVPAFVCIFPCSYSIRTAANVEKLINRTGSSSKKIKNKK